VLPASTICKQRIREAAALLNLADYQIKPAMSLKRSAVSAKRTA
jgi:hypothetical protein